MPLPLWRTPAWSPPGKGWCPGRGGQPPRWLPSYALLGAQQAASAASCVVSVLYFDVGGLRCMWCSVVSALESAAVSPHHHRLLRCCGPLRENKSHKPSGIARELESEEPSRGAIGTRSEELCVKGAPRRDTLSMVLLCCPCVASCCRLLPIPLPAVLCFCGAWLVTCSVVFLFCATMPRLRCKTRATLSWPRRLRSCFCKAHGLI